MFPCKDVLEDDWGILCCLWDLELGPSACTTRVTTDLQHRHEVKDSFLPTWALTIFTDMLEAVRCKSSCSLARRAKLAANFYAGVADFITSCSKGSKGRATAEPVSHLTILVAAFCQCSVRTACMATVSPPLVLQTNKRILSEDLFGNFQPLQLF